ncbi:hypothetical protein APR41_17595 [Salegentibacter salinarum]|uniref:Uncharacterized protein n=1 Tax=Salegentibacter salinarum TaxID=447422 RepID=A0A2N0TVQ8_9FLAO|nr:hypothetical protein [Salegentibacter salinarum]PKD18820.1 hypothetical protein APR41_17595 [Salegentibacter salinarum]
MTSKCYNFPFWLLTVYEIYLFLLFALIFGASSFSQTEEQLSQLAFDDIRDSIRKDRFSDRTKAINAAEAYILRGKRENDKTEEWLGKPLH